MILLRSIVVLFTYFVVSVNSQSACKTPVGEEGFCVPAKDCSIIVNILSNAPKPLSQKVLDYLKSSHCRTENEEHYVCCAARHRTSPTPAPPTPTPVTPTPTPPVIESDTLNPTPDIVNVDDHPNLKLLPLSDCGRVKINKVSFGHVPTIKEFPWMAMLFYQTNKGLQFQCGGALISSRYVLTAAHCVTGIDDILVFVRLGEYDTHSEIDCEKFGTEVDCTEPAQDIEIEEVIFHPEYNNIRFANDVALIRLSRDVNITTETVQAICLPVTEASQRQKLNRVIVSGWGFTEYNLGLNLLIKSSLPVISNAECQKIFRRSVRIRNSQMCAGGKNMISSCKGDSGGPLFFPGRIYSQRYVQYGIISAGAKNCVSPNNFPGIYAKVLFYIKWILDQLKP